VRALREARSSRPCIELKKRPVGDKPNQRTKETRMRTTEWEMGKNKKALREEVKTSHNVVN
jgi:hypothetical protein